MSEGVAWLAKRLRGGLRSERRATGRAEFRGRAHLTSTAWTGRCELGPTVLAELRSLLILKATARTAHAASLLLRACQGKEKAGLVVFDNYRLPAR
jgi:hypothetical protein